MSPNARRTAVGHRGVDVEARSRRPVWCLAATIGTLEARCRIMKDGPDLAELSLLPTSLPPIPLSNALGLGLSFGSMLPLYSQPQYTSKPSQAKPSRTSGASQMHFGSGVLAVLLGLEATSVLAADCALLPHMSMSSYGGSGAQLPEHLQGTEQTGATPEFVTPRTRRTATHMNYGRPVISPSLEPPLAVVSP